jgi:dihydrofolate reductase
LGLVLSFATIIDDNISECGWVFGAVRYKDERFMAKLRVHNFSISIEGYGAGPNQGLDNPLGVGGMALHQWFFPTRTFQQMNGRDGGATGADDDFAARSFVNVGAWILGRNMFGPVRGPWPDDTWKGWWGRNPPYHVPVFVLTNHPRPSITMDGGTVFHFVADGINAALARASEAAKGRDVQIGGGVETIRQYLAAALIDEMHLVISPVLLGAGEHLLTGIDTPKLGYQCTQHVTTPNATHVVLTKHR